MFLWYFDDYEGLKVQIETLGPLVKCYIIHSAWRTQGKTEHFSKGIGSQMRHSFNMSLLPSFTLSKQQKTNYYYVQKFGHPAELVPCTAPPWQVSQLEKAFCYQSRVSQFLFVESSSITKVFQFFETSEMSVTDSSYQIGPYIFNDVEVRWLGRPLQNLHFMLCLLM